MVEYSSINTAGKLTSPSDINLSENNWEKNAHKDGASHILILFSKLSVVKKLRPCQQETSPPLFKKLLGMVELYFLYFNGTVEWNVTTYFRKQLTTPSPISFTCNVPIFYIYIILILPSSHPSLFFCFLHTPHHRYFSLLHTHHIPPPLCYSLLNTHHIITSHPSCYTLLFIQRFTQLTQGSI